MGARVNFVLKTDVDMPRIVLYSHWGEESWREDLAHALTKAERRLGMGDVSYATRIIIDQLSKEGRDEETGFGLYLAPDNMMFWDTTVEVDLIEQMVNDSGNWHSFSSFCEYHLEEIPNNHDFSGIN
jgi:hypothetical protein